MTVSQLHSKILSLKPEQQKEVEKFIDFLQFQEAQKGKEKQHSKRKVGFAKGKIKMSSDFDAPLEDFEEYM